MDAGTVARFLRLPGTPAGHLSMCGLIGIVGREPVRHDLYEGLTVLQHRGQDAAGIVTYDADGRVHHRRGSGLARDVFTDKSLAKLRGNIGIGHLRYPTAGHDKPEEVQPFYVNSPFGIALSHNGNLVNTDQLRRELFRDDKRHINTGSDSEILLNILAHELLKQDELRHHDPEVLFRAVKGVHRRCTGAYSTVSLIASWGLLAFRDPHGIRPLVFGHRDTDKGPEYIIASESVALDILGFTLDRDLAPGEALFISLDGSVHSQALTDVEPTPCIFEYVYFSRPDSVMNGVSVQRSRMRMGKRLANKILREWPGHDINVVIPIPDTSRTAALEMAYRLNLPYREGFIKNRYIGRTFIMPDVGTRRQSVRRKLNPIRNEYEGMNVLLVDDSIVRGTTSREIVQMARDAGAAKVYFSSASPPIRHPNIYGIDMPDADELIAHNRSIEEVCETIGADRLIYQDLPDLIGAVQEGNPELSQFDCSVFTGEYVTELPDGYLEKLAKRRSDPATKSAAANR